MSASLADVGTFCDQLRAAAGGYAACNRCPIQSACHSDCAPLTQANLDAWQRRCVDALDRHQGGGK